MSLRLRLVLAFGYVLLFAIIALEVPLTLNFSRRVDSEIKAEASAGAQAVAAAASGRLTNGPGNVARATVLPLTSTGSSTATGVRIPVRPT